jgi:hypothetical protein
MKAERYYYLRNNKNQPVVTVCLIVENGYIMARGIAICSKQDMPCKSIGRAIAQTRANHALHSKENCLKMKRLNLDTVNFASTQFLSSYKSTLYPEPTRYETEYWNGLLC